ncbi:MAG: D-alanine--D-alanine ligase family protein [Caldilineaceae bacterium]
MNNGRKLRVGVLFGGRSGEHEVSLNSARNVMDALQRAGHTVIPIGIGRSGRWLTGGDPMARLSDGLTGDAGPVNGREQTSWALLPQAGTREALPELDVIFPVLHGTYGEDGTVQGLLEMANIPYVGCGVLASAVAMDKLVAKQLFAQAGLVQVAYVGVRRRQWRADPNAVVATVEHALDYPVFVKPANLGSSVGVSKARNRAELATALDLAAAYDAKIVVEAAVPHAREIEVSVLGNDAPEASVPGEIVPGNEFYDYAAKYVSDNSRLIIPAALDDATTAYVRAMAVRAFQAVDATGLARVDFLLDDRSGEIFLNELNTMPGFTRISMYPKLWEASGVSYPELVDRLLALALEHYAERQENSTEFALTAGNIE